MEALPHEVCGVDKHLKTSCPTPSNFLLCELKRRKRTSGRHTDTGKAKSSGLLDGKPKLINMIAFIIDTYSKYFHNGNFIFLVTLFLLLVSLT